MATSTKTHSELLFEDYLRTLPVDFAYEPEVAGRHKRPDYRMEINGKVYWFEVKELTGRLLCFGASRVQVHPPTSHGFRHWLRSVWRIHNAATGSGPDSGRRTIPFTFRGNAKMRSDANTTI